MLKLYETLRTSVAYTHTFLYEYYIYSSMLFNLFPGGAFILFTVFTYVLKNYVLRNVDF